jgi:omega-amidase
MSITTNRNMSDLRVTTIQTNLHWENPTANLAMLEEKISKIRSGTDVIILPETFTTGFSMNVQSLAEPMNLHTFKWMRNMAERTGALLLGSCIIKEDGHYFNRLIWMESNGSFQHYDKRHLFRMAGEDKVFSSGRSRLIAEWKGWKICPMVCYDLRFPAWCRNRYNKDDGSLAYDLLVYVANWPAARSHHWQTLLHARAIENLSYVVGVNRVGIDGKGIAYEGKTLVLNAKGEPLYEVGSVEESRTTTLSQSDLQDWRSKFPAYLDADEFQLT